MKAHPLRLGDALIAILCCVLVGAGVTIAASAAQPAEGSAQTVKGLQITAAGVARARRVSLQDCPPGENIVRGVIRPNESNEFATVSIEVEVLPSFTAAEIEKPLVYDDAGNEYKTAQSFRDVDSKASYSCQFSFRVPEGTKLVRFVIGDASFDIGEPRK